MRKLSRSLLVFTVLAAVLPLNANPDGSPAASAVLADACFKAKNEKKIVMVAFHRSWCGWCHKMDAVLKRPEVKPVFDKYFVTAWLTVLESPDKKADENPGGAEMLKNNGG